MKCEYNSAMLRDTIEIQRLTTTPDGVGGSTSAWNKIYDMKAKVETLSGGERYVQMRLETNATIKIIMRYVDITTKDIIIFNGKKLDIVFINNIENRNLWLKIDAKEGGAV